MSPTDARPIGETPRIPLHDGDRLDCGPAWGVLRVLEVPGHSHGHIALWDEARRLLFSGDTWFGGDVVGSHSPKHAAALYASVDRLRALQPAVLCPGHGPIVFEGEIDL
eukprot:TRINITY_DN997_c0_g1_i1.p1 TRINITY_DN997_c0_g1~~TRINITY_DN997_c0_g1_i1.p1  ORF type:complete len:109 (+),score=11.65 TRINITY_DN997_c0_g1_i1:424-750(+)